MARPGQVNASLGKKRTGDWGPAGRGEARTWRDAASSRKPGGQWAARPAELRPPHAVRSGSASTVGHLGNRAWTRSSSGERLRDSPVGVRFQPAESETLQLQPHRGRLGARMRSRPAPLT